MNLLGFGKKKKEVTEEPELLDEPVSYTNAPFRQKLQSRLVDGQEVIVTTLDNVPGYRVTRIEGMVFFPAVMGSGPVAEALAGITDMFGTRSAALEGKFDRGVQSLLDELAERAQAAGCNGVIGVDIDLMQMDKNRPAVTVSATFVELEKVPDFQEETVKSLELLAKQNAAILEELKLNNKFLAAQIKLSTKGVKAPTKAKGAAKENSAPATVVVASDDATTTEVSDLSSIDKLSRPVMPVDYSDREDWDSMRREGLEKDGINVDEGTP